MWCRSGACGCVPRHLSCRPCHSRPAAPPNVHPGRLSRGTRGIANAHTIGDAHDRPVRHGDTDQHTIASGAYHLAETDERTHTSVPGDPS